MQMAELLIAIDDRLNSDGTKSLDKVINDLQKSFNKILKPTTSILKTVLSSEKTVGNDDEVYCGEAAFYAAGKVYIRASLKANDSNATSSIEFRIYKNGVKNASSRPSGTAYATNSIAIAVNVGDVLTFKIANTYTGTAHNYFGYCQSITVCGSVDYVTNHDVVE